MMNSSLETILPDSIAIQRDIAAFDYCVAQYLKTIPIERIFVYNIDQVVNTALPILAAQFDVLGYKGLRLALTEADKRSIIKRAIELHKYKGTVWAVKEAMKSVGFADAVITEHVAGPTPIWANFSVTLLNDGVGISDTSIADLRRMIEEYKNQRSNLVEINMIIQVLDTIQFPEDDTGITENILNSDQVLITNRLIYDGSVDYDGSYDHSGDSDTVTIIQI